MKLAADWALGVVLGLGLVGCSSLRIQALEGFAEAFLLAMTLERLGIEVQSSTGGGVLGVYREESMRRVVWLDEDRLGFELRSREWTADGACVEGNTRHFTPYEVIGVTAHSAEHIYVAGRRESGEVVVESAEDAPPPKRTVVYTGRDFETVQSMIVDPGGRFFLVSPDGLCVLRIPIDGDGELRTLIDASTNPDIEAVEHWLELKLTREIDSDVVSKHVFAFRTYAAPEHLSFVSIDEEHDGALESFWPISAKSYSLCHKLPKDWSEPLFR